MSFIPEKYSRQLIRLKCDSCDLPFDKGSKLEWAWDVDNRVPLCAHCVEDVVREWDETESYAEACGRAWLEAEVRGLKK